MQPHRRQVTGEDGRVEEEEGLIQDHNVHNAYRLLQHDTSTQQHTMMIIILKRIVTMFMFLDRGVLFFFIFNFAIVWCNIRSVRITTVATLTRFLHFCCSRQTTTKQCCRYDANVLI